MLYVFPHLDPLVMKSLAERVQGCPKGHWEWQLYMRDVISVDNSGTALRPSHWQMPAQLEEVDYSHACKCEY